MFGLGGNDNKQGTIGSTSPSMMGQFVELVEDYKTGNYVELAKDGYNAYMAQQKSSAAPAGNVMSGDHGTSGSHGGGLLDKVKDALAGGGGSHGQKHGDAQYGSQQPGYPQGPQDQYSSGGRQGNYGSSGGDGQYGGGYQQGNTMSGAAAGYGDAPRGGHQGGYDRQLESGYGAQQSTGYGGQQSGYGGAQRD